MICEGPNYGKDVPIREAWILAVAQNITSGGFGS